MKTKRLLGQTNIKVHPIGLGAMPLSLEDKPSEAQSLDVIKAFVNNGGNFIDTANVYCSDDSNVGHNEKLIAKALNKFNAQDKIFVASKGGLRRPKGNWTVDASPSWLRQSCEKSLKDLNTDSIFLYQLHAPDPEILLTDSVGELLNLKNEGKIQHIGLSNVNVEQIQLALSITQIMSVQNRCSLFDKKSFANGVIPFCEKNNITFIAHSPVGGHFQHKQLTDNNVLRDLADKHNSSVYQIVLTWLLHKSESILPIPGATKVSSISDSMKAVDLALNKEDLRLLDNNIK